MLGFGTIGDINWFVVFELLMLLLIGIGPKIALVPFIEMSADLDKETTVAVANKAVRTAITWSLILVLLGWFLMVLLHFSTGSVLVAGGIVLMLLALHMLTSGGHEENILAEHFGHEKDPMEMALYPLAVPYLLNPVGIAVLVIASSQISSILDVVILVVLVLLVGLIDLLLFRNIDAISKFMDPAKMGVTEAVFGVLLAALAVELAVHGLAELGVITPHLATEEVANLLQALR
jgi:small neutral amino acid transporter SnatA (MarC family)